MKNSEAAYYLSSFDPDDSYTWQDVADDEQNRLFKADADAKLVTPSDPETLIVAPPFRNSLLDAAKQRMEGDVE